MLIADSILSEMQHGCLPARNPVAVALNEI